MRLADISLRTKVFAGVLLPSIALVMLPVLFNRASKRQADTAGWVKHTYDTLQRSESILADVRRLQALAIGRRVRPDPRVDDAWIRAGEIFDRDITELRGVTADNRVQAERIAEVGGQIRSWRTTLDRSLIDKSTEVQPLVDLILGTKGISPNGEAERLLQGFVREERRLLDIRMAANDQATRWNASIINIGSILAVLANLSTSAWLLAGLIRPVRVLTDAARKLQDGDLDARIPEPGADELGRLGSVFNVMATALQKKTRDLEKRDVQASVLRVSEVLSATNDPAHLLESALDRILEVTQTSAGALFLRTGADESLRMLVSSGIDTSGSEIVVRPGEGMVGRAARGSAPLFVAADPDAQPLAIGQWSGPQRPAEMAYQPLRSGPELVGVLALAGASPFGDRTRNVLPIIAGQFGPAIQNALSHQTLRRQAVELEARNARLDEQRLEIESSNRELIAASRLKSEFLANMSHELRTPLTIILGFTNTVLRGTQGELNPEQAGSLKRVYDNGRHLLDLINDILDLSKIEAGQMEIDAIPTNPRGLVETIADNFLGLARAKGLALRVELDSDLPADIVTDEARLRQVLVNLVGNAIKFTDRGEVVLAVRRSEAGQGGGCRFEVRDTGPGIDTHDLPKIFEQFRQLDGKTTRRAGGTGLGLSIVRKLVTMLGGTMEVQSKVGVGTSFLLNLPTEPCPATTPGWVDRPRDVAPPRQGVVLAIDDDREFQALLREAIKGFPATLHTASSGREGLERAIALRPDAITLDVQMPDMDGWTVLNALKANTATAEIPVIMLTVLQRRGLGLMLGAADYLTKPLDRDRLAKALRRVGAMGGGPVLVIDDDPDILRLLGAELEAGGYPVRLASNGREGLRLARQEPPAAVILDLMMPEMDGFEVAAELNRNPNSGRDIPILVLTARDLTSDDIRRLNGRIDEIVQKGSMTLDALVARLSSVLRGLGVVAASTPETTDV